MAKDVLVGGIMTHAVVTVREENMLADVVDKMKNAQISCIVVVDDEHKPVGIITERDLVRLLGEVLEDNSDANTKVSTFMSGPPIAVSATTPLFDALVLTQGRNIRHLPVVDDKGFLRGILSYTDLAHAYEHVIEKQRELIEKELGDKTSQLQQVNEQLKALSMEDALLGIGNRRAMEVDLAYTHNLASRYKRPYSVVLFDVDCFKLYNDHYGHQAGDEALRLVTEHLRCSIRKADRLFRYGGEELLLLLPETALEGAKVLSSRIVKELAERNIPHVKSSYNVLTMSAGIGSPSLHSDAAKDWQSIVLQADKGLYLAKENGRNCVCHLDMGAATTVLQ